MKCVGGPQDGQEYAIERGQTLVRVPMLERMHWFDKQPLEPVGALVKYVDYTVRMLRFARRAGYVDRDGAQIFDPAFDELKYLAPADWSDFKAVSYQFSK